MSVGLELSWAALAVGGALGLVISGLRWRHRELVVAVLLAVTLVLTVTAWWRL